MVIASTRNFCNYRSIAIFWRLSTSKNIEKPVMKCTTPWSLTMRRADLCARNVAERVDPADPAGCLTNQLHRETTPRGQGTFGMPRTGPAHTQPIHRRPPLRERKTDLIASTYMNWQDSRSRRALPQCQARVRTQSVAAVTRILDRLELGIIAHLLFQL